MTTDIHQILLERLHQQGVNTEEAAALLRDLSKILEPTKPWNWPGSGNLETSTVGLDRHNAGLPIVAAGACMDGIWESKGRSQM